MNIAIYISAYKGRNTEVGGHYYSCISYFNNLNKNNNCFLLFNNQLESGTPLSIIKNQLNGCKTNIKQKIQEIILTNKIDIFLSFSEDPVSLNLRTFIKKHLVKYVYIKPGGPNPKHPYYYSNGIVFSQENYNGLKQKVKNCFVVSNRIDTFDSDKERIQSLISEYPQKKINVVRISRINAYSYPTFAAAINFHLYLQQNGYDVQTHLIGVIEDLNTAENISAIIKQHKNIFLLTEESYIKNTKQILDYYNIVLGIGRGFWEGVALNKVVLGYSKSCKLPVFVTPENITEISKMNFSPRTKGLEPSSIELNPDFFNSTEQQESYVKYLSSYFKEHYSSENLENKLIQCFEKFLVENYSDIIKSKIVHILKRIKKLL